MTKYIFVSPHRYIQGQGVIADLGEELKSLGQKPLLLADKDVWKITKKPVENSLSHADLEFHYVEFNEEASSNEIERIAESAKENKTDIIVGIGGGKTLDTAKAVADEVNRPVAIVPTTASTDAPTSGLSVIYSDKGVFEGYKFYDKNPDLVLIDTGIVVSAPLVSFASGMADAMSTLVEVKAAVRSKGKNMVGAAPTIAAQAIAEAAEKTLFNSGYAAYTAVEKQLVTPHVEAIVEANTLLSGLGFENGGLAAAHAVHNGFTALDGDIHKLSHGQKVAYGTLVQLVLEGIEKKELQKYIAFFQSIKMPTTLEEMHLDQTSFEDLISVGKLATSEEETFDNLDAEITPEQVAYAILAVDQLTKGMF